MYEPRIVRPFSTISTWWTGGRAVPVHPEDHDPGAHPGGLDRVRKHAADGVDYDVRSTRHELGASGGPLLGRQDEVGADGEGDRGSMRARLDGHDPARARTLGTRR